MLVGKKVKMSLQDLIYHQRDRAAFEASRVTIWTNPARRDEIYLERQKIEEVIYQINRLVKPVNEDPFARMGGGRAPEPVPKYIKDSIAPLCAKIEELTQELNSLIDVEASRRESSRLLQEYLGVATM